MKENPEILYSYFGDTKYHVCIYNDKLDFIKNHSFTVEDFPNIPRDIGDFVVINIRELSSPDFKAITYVPPYDVHQAKVFYINNNFLFELLKLCMSNGAYFSTRYNGIICLVFDFREVMFSLKSGKLTAV